MEEVFKIINQDMINAVMRKKGELNLTTKALAEETGVSSDTLGALFNKKRVKIRKTTQAKLESWLFKQL